MTCSVESNKEKIIKSKMRVQNHGEVFTPMRIVNRMLNLPKIREACQNVTSTFLEPTAGEGVFLVEILNRKLKMVANHYGDDLTRYENYSLLALSTLYGVELLEDNAQKCVMNMFKVYYDAYRQQATEHCAKMKNKVLDSAKVIIANNIALGNFLTKLTTNGNPITFSEWQPINLRKDTKIIKIQRTEYTIDDILDGTVKQSNASTHLDKVVQITLFNLFDDDKVSETAKKRMRYVPVRITDVYKEEMEEIDGQNNN
ncbi:methylase [Sulfobacillus thermotolerans]|uniref:Methylase n=1 Tax=Sulfobacillus thermotolerans TaxID=338644 RepID=A0ABM6RP82_9FIRM|nr:methylase [Sulfobacillus thermotolerans]